MTDGKTRAEVATFDALLADPADKEKMIERQNMEAQKELQKRMGMMGPPQPPRRRKPKDGNGYPH